MKIVFTSGYTEQAIFEPKPGVAFLPKPFLPDELALEERAPQEGT